MVKLLGARYDPQTDTAHMSCEMFETPTQNKRYLGDLIDTLIAHAKGEGDDTAKDMFTDVPPDFRHVKWKKQLKFPAEWALTPQKKAMIKAARSESKAAEAARLEEGKIVDGARLIEQSFQRLMAPVQARTLVAPGRGPIKQRR